MLDVIRQDPQLHGYDRSRWTLLMLMEKLSWLTLNTAAGMSQLLSRLKISYKRGRDYIHSPDTHYELKKETITQALSEARSRPEKIILLYLDEFSYYRQPTITHSFEACGSSQPLARRSHRSNTRFRGLGALNAVSGQLTYLQRSRITISVLRQFWQLIRDTYPQADRIYIVVDNWPVHYHPDVLQPLELQDQAWAFRTPDNWPTQPSLKMPTQAPLPLQFLPLPTYASWLNPIEKLWRKVQQEILHLHRCSDQWDDLKERVAQFMAQFQSGSLDLLRYVGLLPI